MEIVIVVCLLIVVALLAWDKISERSQTNAGHSVQIKQDKEVDNIIGRPRPLQRLNLPRDASKIIIPNSVEDYSPSEHQITNEDYDENIEQDTGLVGDLKYVPDLEEEEAEWRDTGEFFGDTGFATGVTFEELSMIGVLLQRELPESSTLNSATRIAHNLDGTELLGLMEKSIDDASQKIAKLLNNPTANMITLSTMKSGDISTFNVTDFI